MTFSLYPCFTTDYPQYDAPRASGPTIHSSPPRCLLLNGCSDRVLVKRKEVTNAQGAKFFDNYTVKSLIHRSWYHCKRSSILQEDRLSPPPYAAPTRSFTSRLTSFARPLTGLARTSPPTERFVGLISVSNLPYLRPSGRRPIKFVQNAPM